MSEPYPVLGKDNANSLRKGDMVYLDFSGHSVQAGSREEVLVI